MQHSLRPALIQIPASKIYKSQNWQNFVNSSKQIIKSKVIFAVKLPATFVVRSKSKVIKVFATARDFLFVVNAHIQMRVHVRALVRQSPARRRRPSNGRR